MLRGAGQTGAEASGAREGSAVELRGSGGSAPVPLPAPPGGCALGSPGPAGPRRREGGREGTPLGSREIKKERKAKAIFKKI